MSTPKNVIGKARKPGNGYASWTDPRSGWMYELLKGYQADNGAIYARWLVDVDGDFHEMGDMYVQELRAGVLRSTDLKFDGTVWDSEKSFLEWVK